jgi:hypothetical protein
MINAPPSGFLLKMGAASCINTRWDMTLVVQHWDMQLVADPGMVAASPYLVPLVVAQVIEISELGEPCPPGIVDDDVEATQLLNAFLDEPLHVLHDTNLLDHCVRECISGWSRSCSHGLDDSGFDSMSLHLLSHFVGLRFAADVVDDNIGSFLGEPLAQECPEASARLVSKYREPR